MISITGYLWYTKLQSINQSVNQSINQSINQYQLSFKRIGTILLQKKIYIYHSVGTGFTRAARTSLQPLITPSKSANSGEEKPFHRFIFLCYRSTDHALLWANDSSAIIGYCCIIGMLSISSERFYW